MTDVITPTPILGWVNVGLGLTFIVFDVATSAVLGLGVGRSLLTASLRCILQLALVAGLLQKVFEAENPWAVAGITCELGPFQSSDDTPVNDRCLIYSIIESSGHLRDWLVGVPLYILSGSYPETFQL